jgi:nitroreductase
MDAIEALRTRRSTREFKPDPVPKNVIEQVVDCGRRAPSAVNVQPVDFVVVTDAARRREIAAMTDYGAFIAQAPVCIVVVARPVKYYLEDGAAAVENILVAARALGLGSCWVAGDKKPYAEQVCRFVGAAKGHQLVALVPVGFPSDSPQPAQPAKRPLEEVLHWEKF